MTSIDAERFGRFVNDGHPAGLYFCLFQAGDKVAARKMLLVR